jgi:glutaredoxin-related protein
MKKVLIVLIIFAGIFGLYKFFSNSQQQGSTQGSSDNPDLVLYWGEGCPHCEVVKDYIKKNSVDQKMKITQKEVFYNKQNQKELQDTVSKYCPDSGNGQGIGVPIALDTKNNKCISGDTPIIDFISQKTGQNQ